VSPGRARGLALALSLVAFATLAAPAASQPDPSAPSALLVDARNGEILFERSPEERRSIASATKLMTALLTLERAAPDDVFRAPAYDALPVESKIDLRKGERMRVDDLLEALLLESANDAAVTLAVNISGSRKAFVRDMNRRAGALGLNDTHYANPIGLDDPANYSSARDLTELARRLMQDERFAEIVDMPSATLESGARPRTVDNRNALVRRVPLVDGIKTGHTAAAGYVLVGSASGRGVRVISAVLGAPSESARDRDSLGLLRYGLDQFRRVRALRRGAELASADVELRDEHVPLTTARTVVLTVRRGERVGRRLDVPDEIEGPLPKGERVGTVELLYRGDVVRRVPLVLAEAVPEPSTATKIWSALDGLLISLALLAGGTTAVLVALRLRAVRNRRAGRATQ
jgi:serine-type D-Ala-D-Ala carboxypeptidase (penicillin-binding protein 5/6)